MDKQEAGQVLAAQLQPFRAKPYAELARMIGQEPVDVEVTGPTGCRYRIEIQAFWDAKKKGNIRILGAIDDGSWRWTVAPLCDDFIKTPQDTFVGE
jgi:hypothetical protein